MRRALFGVASTLALVIAGPTLATEIAAEATVVDPVIVLGARTEKQAGEIPASVSVITAVDLEDRLTSDIKAAIQYEPGVSVRSSPSRFGAALGTTGRDGNAGFNIRGLEDTPLTPLAFSWPRCSLRTT